MSAPTPRQLEVLRALYDLWESSDCIWPTIRELGARIGVRSTNGVNDVIKALERRGLVERTRMKSRTLRLTEAGFQLVEAAR